jgi:hypothetical protein
MLRYMRRNISGAEHLLRTGRRRWQTKIKCHIFSSLQTLLHIRVCYICLILEIETWLRTRQTKKLNKITHGKGSSDLKLTFICAFRFFVTVRWAGGEQVKARGGGRGEVREGKRGRKKADRYCPVALLTSVSTVSDNKNDHMLILFLPTAALRCSVRGLYGCPSSCFNSTLYLTQISFSAAYLYPLLLLSQFVFSFTEIFTSSLDLYFPHLSFSLFNCFSIYLFNSPPVFLP